MATRFESAIPKLPSADIERSLKFYTQLGFAKTVLLAGYGMAERDGVQLHFWLCDDPEIARSTGCRINVEGLTELYASYSSLNIIHPSGAMETKPWGFREFSILDIDGNLITFAERAG